MISILNTWILFKINDSKVAQSLYGKKLTEYAKVKLKNKTIRESVSTYSKPVQKNAPIV
jgi:hypothetical protein